MKALVVGATGATGLANDTRLSPVHATVADLGPNDLARHLKDCSAVISCLGHTMTLRGIFGEPRRLVTDAIRDLCAAIAANPPNAPSKPARLLLMNTAGNRHRGLREPVHWVQHCLIGLIRLLLPPHADNEQAAEFLRTQVGSRQ